MGSTTNFGIGSEYGRNRMWYTIQDFDHAIMLGGFRLRAGNSGKEN